MFKRGQIIQQVKLWTARTGLALAVVAIGAPSSAQPQQEGQPSLRQIEQELNRLEAERSEARDESEKFFGWESGVRRLHLGSTGTMDPNWSVVEIDFDADRVAAVLEFAPEDFDRRAAADAADANDSPVRLILQAKGRQWIQLTPGRWELRMSIGHPGSGVLLELPPAPLRLDRGSAYRWTFAEREENRARRRLETLEEEARKVPERSRQGAPVVYDSSAPQGDEAAGDGTGEPAETIRSGGDRGRFSPSGADPRRNEGANERGPGDSEHQGPSVTVEINRRD